MSQPSDAGTSPVTRPSSPGTSPAAQRCRACSWSSHWPSWAGSPCWPTSGTSKKLPLFGGIERARFRRQVVPGETLELEVTVGRLSARAGTGHGRAHVDGKTACEADLLFVLVDREA